MPAGVAPEQASKADRRTGSGVIGNKPSAVMAGGFSSLASLGWSSERGLGRRLRRSPGCFCPALQIPGFQACCFGEAFRSRLKFFIHALRPFRL